MNRHSSFISPRAVSAQIVLQVLDEGKSLSTLIPQAQSQVSPKDLALLQEICFGVCRVLPRLERILKLLLTKPLKGKTRIVHCLLLVGLYQLLYLRVPDHAAISETVNAVKPLKSDNFRALVNGVLRRFLREQKNILALADKHWQTEHPEWLVNRLKKAYPNWRNIIEANNQKPPMWIRVNSQHSNTDTYRQLLSDLAENPMEHSACSAQDVPPCAIKLSRPTAVTQLPHFTDGWVTVQDAHAQWSALLLGAQNGEQILDACAAPGGKTTHILELAPQAQVTALDIESSRLVRVKENLARLGQQAKVICGDACMPAQWSEKTELFDRILLDAPCSATGVIRRHPDIKWLRKEEDIAELAALQERILHALWAKLNVGGTLLYATCSVLPEENREQIERFLNNTPNARLEPLDFGDKRCDMQQFLPNPQGGDGFFYAKLVKVAEK